MNEDSFNLDIRTFLKEVGVTSHKEISKAVSDAVNAGNLKGNETLQAKMVLTIESLELNRTIEGEIALE